MRKMRSHLALMLVLALLTALAPSGALGQESAVADEPAPELIVGNPTAMKGDFFTEMFGNNGADLDIRSLIHGYNLVNWDQTQGTYVFDPTVVTRVRVIADGEGNHTYFMALADDLFYSDGTPITAWDYAFSLLMRMAPEMEEIGAKIYRAEHILGYDAYLSGQAEALAGVEVITEYQLAVTLDHRFLPFFFETGLLLCVPYPVSVIAPGCRVYDDGNGAYIGNIDQTIQEPLFTAELLRQTVMDPETGYNSHPAVSSGPYTLTSFDGNTAHLALNPYFKGAWVQDTGTLLSAENEDGLTPLAENYVMTADQDDNPLYLVKPVIERLAVTCVDSDQVPELFEKGELHLVNKLVYGPTINTLMEGAEKLSLGLANYPRIGMTSLTFSLEFPTVRETAVRQAIAWCIDREALTEAYTAGFGVRTDGYYGIAKWEYMLVNGDLAYPVTLLEEGQEMPNRAYSNLYARTQDEYDAAVAAWENLSLSLTEYTVDTEQANQLLDEAGWTLNREGGAYRRGTDDVRCKLVDGTLTALDLTLLYAQGNHIADSFQESALDHLQEAGIRLTLVPAPMDELLKAYYRETPRETDMIYLGTNFHVVVDPSITYCTETEDDLHHERWNTTFSDDRELYELAVAMRQTEPGDLYGYITRWIAFQERFNEILPAIPLYSNIYFDFYVQTLQNYLITSHVSWGQAILESVWTGEP